MTFFIVIMIFRIAIVRALYVTGNGYGYENHAEVNLVSFARAVRLPRYSSLSVYYYKTI